MRKILWLPLVAFFMYTCGENPQKPKLVIFISVDQLKPDLLDKYSPLFTGGYKWFRDNSIQFTNTHHEHAYTTTGPGHFVLSSGRHPGPAGILGNYWWEKELSRSWYAAEDTLSETIGDGGRGKSYRLINSTTLGDWLKAISPLSKVYSIASKDRSSIMLGGQNPDLAIWYNWKGSFTSSTYYVEALPEWLNTFNHNFNPIQYRDSVWDRSMSEEIYTAYSRPDNYQGEVIQKGHNSVGPVFPYRFDEHYSDEDIVNDIIGTPWGDKTTLELSLKCIQNEQLGQDGITDILFISLSGNDWIGHDFGPYSQEMLDNLVKTDHYLDQFIKGVGKEVNMGQVLFILTSDHGSMAIPEYLHAKGEDAGRIDKQDKNARFQKAIHEIKLLFGEGACVEYGNFFYFKSDLDKNAKNEMTKIIRKYVTGLEGVENILTLDEIMSAPAGDSYYDRLKNSIHLEKSPDVWLLPKKNWTYRWPTGATHGTPFDYDTHVPFFIVGKTFKPQHISAHVATVDIAPTIAGILGVPVPEEVDGNLISNFP